MSQAPAPAAPANAPTTQTPPTTTPDQGNQGQGTPAPSSTGLEFIPEAFRESSWAKKYTTPEDFFKGVDNMSKMMGQKQIVEGIKPPGQDATDEDWGKFFNEIGRPESADKYQLEDIQIQGIDTKAEREMFTSMAHKNGLTQKQAEGLYKDYLNSVKENVTKQTQDFQTRSQNALKEAFGDNFQGGFDLAKKGARAIGIADTLDQEGLSANPLVLKLCAKLGEMVGEDTKIDGKSSSSNESLLEEAVRLQKSAEYQNGDKATHKKVEEIYKKVYPN